MNHSSLPFSSSSQEKNGKTDRKWENPPNQLARNIAPLPKVRRVSVKGQPHGQAQLTRKHEPSRLINIGHGQLKIGTYVVSSRVAVSVISLKTNRSADHTSELQSLMRTSSTLF